MDKRIKSKTSWNRLLWAVQMRSALDRPEPILIGVTWDHIGPPAYDGEPLRCLLFHTRGLARVWCIAATKKFSNHGSDWRFKPIRVRETITTND